MIKKTLFGWEKTNIEKGDVYICVFSGFPIGKIYRLKGNLWNVCFITGQCIADRMHGKQNAMDFFESITHAWFIDAVKIALGD